MSSSRLRKLAQRTEFLGRNLPERQQIAKVAAVAPRVLVSCWLNVRKGLSRCEI
jgi:hypothetical protein